MGCCIFACVTSETKERINVKEKKAHWSFNITLVCVHLHLRWCARLKMLLCGSDRSPISISESQGQAARQLLVSQFWKYANGGYLTVVSFPSKQKRTHTFSESWEWEQVTTWTTLCSFSAQENNRNLFRFLSSKIVLGISLLFFYMLAKESLPEPGELLWSLVITYLAFDLIVFEQTITVAVRIDATDCLTFVWKDF